MWPLQLDPVDPEVFECVETGDLESIGRFGQDKLRPFVPLLARAGLLHQNDASGSVMDNVQSILQNLIQNEAVNNIVSLLQVDYQALEMDVKKELQLRQKLGNREQDSILVQNLAQGVTLEFEKAEGTRKLRLILSEILFIMSQMNEPRQEYYVKVSDLFDNWVYLDEICDALCIALVEMPNILSICDVCEAILHVKYGPSIITRLVANMPDSFVEVCYHLISNGDKCEEDTEGGIIRLEALKMLSKMNPRQRFLIRSRCVEMCRMPALTVFVSLESKCTGSDLVPFLSGVLLGNDQQVRNWFSVYVRNGQKRKPDIPNSLNDLRGAIFSYLSEMLGQSKQNDRVLIPAFVVEGASLLRLLCALKGIAGFKFHEEEIMSLVSFITLKAPTSPQGSRFIILGLCTLLACPALISTPDQEKIIVEWIKSLIKIEYSPECSEVHASFGEILLLMAIHFHSNQLSAISDLVCTTLGMKIAIRVNTMAKIKQIFVQDIFTEQVVTAHAVRVPVTPSLSGELTGFLPVHCIYQLIKSRAFTKHKVPIKDWIYRQILNTCLPLHSVLPALLEVYTQSILVPASSTIAGAKVLLDLTNEPLSDDEVLDVYKSFHTKNLAPQLLVLYYVLLYEDHRLTNCRTLTGRNIKTYSGKLFSQIPIKFLLQEAQKNQNQCGGLFPSLLKLLTTHFPQLCIANEWLEDNIALADPEFTMPKQMLDMNIPSESFNHAFARVSEEPEDSLKLLEACKQLTPHKLWSYSHDIVSQIRKVAQSSVSRKVQDLYRDVWYKLNNVYPRHLWEITSNALLPDGSLHLTADELTIDPLQILRCDPRVFRSAPILDILLHILAASLAASKYFLWKHLQENPSAVSPGFNPQSDVEREELKVALVAVQESAAVQILLEMCLPNEGDKVDGICNDLILKEIQSLICSFLHQMFIADPTLAKLVHFQGYPLELLPVTVKGIPSMHICLDFIPELLGQPELEKQIFAAQLISYLSIQYSLPKSYSIARIAVSTMNNMASGLMSEERAEFFIPSLSALERLCVAFPPLCDEIIALLVHLGKICTAQNAVERNRMSRIVRNKHLLKKVNHTYEIVVQHSMMDRHII